MACSRYMITNILGLSCISPCLDTSEAWRGHIDIVRLGGDRDNVSSPLWKSNPASSFRAITVQTLLPHVRQPRNGSNATRTLQQF
ncbi:hypothetical protein OG21DRAFT_1086674 [Imleria badia]|nr:hypothetical protein OG21DRAFT_1086674 [Imleria badia]